MAGKAEIYLLGESRFFCSDIVFMKNKSNTSVNLFIIWIIFVPKTAKWPKYFYSNRTVYKNGRPAISNIDGVGKKQEVTK